jgi:hypothetical protein
VLQNIILAAVEQRLENLLLDGSALGLFLNVLQLVSKLIGSYLLVYPRTSEVFALEASHTLLHNFLGSFGNLPK